MTPQNLIAAFLGQRFQGKQEEQDRFVLQFLADNADRIEGFSDWCAAQKAQLEANLTDKALEAAKLNTQQQLQAQIDTIDSTIAQIDAASNL